MIITSFLLLILKIFLPLTLIRAQNSGFISLDCGGTESYTDDIGLKWTPDDNLFGQRANISLPNITNEKYYTTVRYFPSDNRKYCYTLPVLTGLRYLVRATFLYGNFDNTNMYPSFDISLGATTWDSIVIIDAVTPIVTEIVLLASAPSLSVCLLNSTSGSRFISTIELRQFNNSMYYTPVETKFFLLLGARVNFGTSTNDSIRYPDDAFDRIWESDSIKKPNYLVNVAPGTQKVSTTKQIFVDFDEKPPMKVMQTAVVGNNGTLTYRMNLDNFPGNAWAFTYMAEIEDLGSNETRKFKVLLPFQEPVSDAVVNVQENAGGKYRLYEPGFWNVSLPFIASLLFQKTNDSTRGPILNAFEVFKYLKINLGSPDANAMASFVTNYPKAKWAQEGGDPCLPASWTWLQCNSDPQPRIISIDLSKNGLTGNIPRDLTNLSGLVELHLESNTLNGTIPDFSGVQTLQIIHLENNQLTGPLPSSLENLPNLQELYVQNNNLSGAIPKGLLRKNIIFNYSGNPNLYKKGIGKNRTIIISSVFGATILFILISACFYIRKRRKQKLKTGKMIRFLKGGKPNLNEVDTETAHKFDLLEIEKATINFERKIGSGGFGMVYYGKLDDGTEIAVKVHNNESNQGIREFLNEVTLLSRIYHKNLVKFIGYSQEEGINILVYEFMHHGALQDHLHGPTEQKINSWITRMEIAEDAAKGIEYLHKGCSPPIVHRDLKSSNILLDKEMRAKVSDFGLSKLMEDTSHISSMVKGTVGYLDPASYLTRNFTEKSDIYSFGIILLELISGHPPISNEIFGCDFPYIVPWARAHIESGNIDAIIDPSLEEYDIQSIWKIAEIAIMCVQEKGVERPNISEVLKDIQEAILIEQKLPTLRADSINAISEKNKDFSEKVFVTDLTSSSSNVSFSDLLVQPRLR
ncbi:hypothetical protein LUZ60_015344 [Juncus effusus]|nr:hypothetical protein LUZ60_015344 [Juncus effusus]